jgi:hypothetical protein
VYVFSFFLFFYPLKLVDSFTNVTSFKLKIITLILTSTIPLNLFIEIILSYMTHLLSSLLFIHFFYTESPLLIETSLLQSYFFLLFIFIYGGLQYVLHMCTKYKLHMCHNLLGG